MQQELIPVTVITGASSGIGKELARLAAADGKNLCIAARGTDSLIKLQQELEQAYKVRVIVVTVDLSLPGAPEVLFAAMRKQGAKAAELINSAGFGKLSAFAAEDGAVYNEMLTVNVVATTQLCALLLPDMLAAGGGKIMNISSTAAFQPVPGFAVYAASKAYILSFSHALGLELKPRGVTVTAFCPGITESGFHKVAGTETTIGYRLSVMALEPVARAGYKAMQAGKAVFIPGLFNRIGALSTRIAPTAFAANLAKRILSP